MTRMGKVELTGARATMLGTLYGRALDADAPEPILHDTMAADAVARLDVDFTTVGLRPQDVPSVVLRARHLDGWTREFLAAHPDATVLHLGCGLDTRVWRVGPGPGVRWFDVDYPEVIELRRELFPARPGYEQIAASVTDPAWLERVPADRPVLVVAEGLTMYLTRAQGEALLRRLVRHFPGGGQMVFDGFSRLGIRLQKLNGVVRNAGATLHWGIGGCAELEAAEPRLRCVTALSAFDVGGWERLRRRERAMVRVARRLPFMRGMAVLYRLAW
jgi:O-methyltransferase involved in polyketide biosynthesis